MIRRECFLPECTVLRSRLNTRNKYKVHLHTFIHARLQQPSRCPPPCWCMPAERWNGEKNDWFSPFPLKQKQELWRTDGLWECQCRCVRGLWWVWSEWAGQTVHFHCTRTHSHVPRKWSGRGGEISLNDYPTPGISVQDWEFSRSSQYFVLSQQNLDTVRFFVQYYYLLTCNTSFTWGKK